MVKIAPSILSADFTNLLDSIKVVEQSGADMLHIDIMDGHFVPNITMGPMIIESIKNDINMPFDVHLMIENPDNYISQFVKAGADIITVHVEACTHLHRTIQNIKSHGIKAGVSLNPGTSLHTIEDILEDIDMVLLMSVNPGFGGQQFIPNTIKRIIMLKAMIDDKSLNVDIEVDGGIKINNVEQVVKAGANIIVAGSAIFHSENIKKTIEEFKKNINKALEK